MVTMSNVWDRATEVVRGRAGQLAGIAALTLFLPALIRDAVPLVATPGTAGFAIAGGLAAIVVLLVAIWGQLALLATATDPGTTRADAYARASARFPAALGVTAVVILAVIALFIPIAVAVGVSGADFSGVATTGRMPDLGGGTVAFIALYALALLIVGIWIAARLAVTNAVVLNERRGIGAFARSWQLTRGITWRLVGVLLLYAIVLVIAVSAAQFITGTLFGLILGRTPLVTFLTAAVGGAVTTAFSVLASAFTAQLYVAVTQRGVATVFE